MKRKEVFKETVTKLQQLSEMELKEASDFVDYLLRKVENRELINDIQELATRGKTFSFLEEEEELYCENDLKKRYS